MATAVKKRTAAVPEKHRQVISREGNISIHEETAGSKAVKYFLIAISAVFLFVMLVLPLITVISEALKKGFAEYLNAVSDPDTKSAVILTLKATVISVIFNTVFGIFAAWAVTKFHFRGKNTCYSDRSSRYGLPDNCRSDLCPDFRKTECCLSVSGGTRS